MFTAREMSTKVCSQCKEVKTLDGFGKKKTSKDGYRPECKACGKKYDAKYYAANVEKKKEYDAKCYAANPEKKKEYTVKYRADNPDYRAKCYAANPEKGRTKSAEYKKAHPEKNRAWVSNYRAAKLEAIPSWLTEEDWQSMEDIGKEADRLTRKTGVKYEVDHIHPLQPPKVVMFEGKMIPLICAFHCPANLQILTRSENRSKRNNFTPYVESA